MQEVGLLLMYSLNLIKNIFLPYAMKYVTNIGESYLKIIDKPHWIGG